MQCHICGAGHTWYIGGNKYFCKNHYEEARIYAKKENREYRRPPEKNGV